ncbi:protein-disulfide reductase DsbD domain-containing protein [Fibrobacterota bacterium]
MIKASMFTILFLTPFVLLSGNISDDPIIVKEITADYQEKLSILKIECLLDIPPPWHVNSGSLKQEYLIPTRVLLADSSKGYLVKREYPDPMTLVLFGQQLEVFDGELRFKTFFYLNADKAFPLRAVLQYQSCDDKMCLPPQFRDFSIMKTGDKGLQTVFQHPPP